MDMQIQFLSALRFQNLVLDHSKLLFIDPK
jgi:hypothetical protein